MLTPATTAECFRIKELAPAANVGAFLELILAHCRNAFLHPRCHFTSEILCHVEEGHLAFFREAQHVVQTSDLILVSNNLDLVFGVVGIKELAKLQKLGTLYLNYTQITDASLKELARLEKLAVLRLAFTQITGTGLKELARLQNLNELHLGYTQITDAGLKGIAKLQNLGTLYLTGTKVTNVGIKDLAKLQNLEWLSVQNSQITFAGVYELLRVLPNCTIPLDKLPDTNKTHKSKIRKSKTP